MPLPPGAYGLSSVSLEAVSSPASAAVGAPPDETGLALPAAQPPDKGRGREREKRGGGRRQGRGEGRDRKGTEKEREGTEREEITLVQRCLYKVCWVSPSGAARAFGVSACGRLPSLAASAAGVGPVCDAAPSPTPHWSGLEEEEEEGEVEEKAEKEGKGGGETKQQFQPLVGNGPQYHVELTVVWCGGHSLLLRSCFASRKRSSRFFISSLCCSSSLRNSDSKCSDCMVMNRRS